MATELQAENFGEVVLKATKPVLVDFHAAWCGPCLQQAPILEKWASANQEKATVAKLDVDAQAELASKYGVMSIPTLILFSGGAECARAVGLQSEASLDALLAKAGN